MKHETVFCPDRIYRYTLWREWGKYGLFRGDNLDQFVQFVGLNPSTADETNDDNTIRRLIAYAKHWGYGGLCMTNVYAFRSRDPKVMKKHPSPVGADNDLWLGRIAAEAALVVCAWGRPGAERGQVVANMLRAQNAKLHYFRLLPGGVPEHPLYLPKTLAPVPWTA